MPPDSATAAGASRAHSNSSSTSEDEQDQPDITQDDGWQDVSEDDGEQLQYVSLFDEKTFSSAEEMLAYCREEHAFDLVGVAKRSGLDFYATVKLVNYVRSAVKSGLFKPDLPDLSALLKDDTYLQPVLEDDALLFSLDELLEANPPHSTESAQHETSVTPSSSTHDPSASRIASLETQLARLQSNFTSYKELVSRTLDTRWQGGSHNSSTPTKPPPGPINTNTDADYFNSYASPIIHETMLKDTIRTNAYRDFIYGHKSLFASKTVLDVGCGTGILSLFAARAGATHVHAVDNSPIVTRAREIAALNHLHDTITFHRGDVETLHETTPSLAAVRGKFDILVSEWMGYALLYEAMLDSVIRARDLYLKPPSSPDGTNGGLIVPSHCTLHLAPCSDPDYRSDTLGFWPSVYGFDFTPVLTAPDFFADAVARDVPSRALCAPSALIRTFALQTIAIADLDFSAPFQFTLDKDVDALDGFCLWFDAFFLPPPANARKELPANVDGGKWRGPGVAFTTGPKGKELTHWQMVWLGLDRVKTKGRELKAGTSVVGTVGYRKSGKRELEIEVEWRASEEDSEERVVESGKQSWLMR